MFRALVRFPVMSALETDTLDDVVLLDADRQPAGRAPRLGVHAPDTPLHLAFSLYLFDDQGRLLLTRRALGKRPGPASGPILLWTSPTRGVLPRRHRPSTRLRARPRY